MMFRLKRNLYLSFIIELLNILLLFIYWHIGYYDSESFPWLRDTMLRIAFIAPIIGYALSLIKVRVDNKKLSSSLTSVYRSQKRPENDESIMGGVIMLLFVIWVFLLKIPCCD